MAKYLGKNVFVSLWWAPSPYTLSKIKLKSSCFLFFIIPLIFSCKKKPIEENGMVYIAGNNDIKDFWIDISPVTVSDFNKFIASTKYKTQAEQFGDGVVFDFKTGNWSLVKGATWQYPFGKNSEKAKPNHPATQVSWNDAIAYCKWAKKRLPSSDEFVFAEKNGKESFGKTYTWGDDFVENNIYKANFWQGKFPENNTVLDGFLTTSPVGFFGKNEAGLTDMGGNVWQWCYDFSEEKKEEKNQRGGSYLCDPMVCHGFKIGGVSSSTPETSLCHVGFRCVKDTF